MTYRTDDNTARLFTAIAGVAAAILASPAWAADASGTWRFEKSIDYAGKQPLPAPKTPVLQIANGQAAFSPTCFVKLSKERYLYSTPFQALLQSGVDESKLDGFLVKHLAFPLKSDKDYYEADLDADCNAPMREFLVSGNRLLVPFAGSAFHAYVRSDGGTARPVDPKVALGGRKLSQLPFSPTNYAALCTAAIPKAKGVPQATAKCAPLYYPYVADAKDTDPLAKLIGTHDYAKGGRKNARDYAPPFASKLHPTFALLPPLKDVLVVRVEDLEGGKEERETMPGVYLSIRDDKVVGQLNEGCTLDERYACVDEAGKKRYQLLESGEFKKL
jgi:hypothetical protein